MLRIHFTDRDLAGVRLAAAPDPLWETALSLHRLRAPGGDAPVFSSWRRRVHREIPSRSVRPQLGLLGTLVPARGYFPDFLTPPYPVARLRDGLAALRATPVSRLRHDVAHGARERTQPAWTRSLATGDRDSLDMLAGAIRDVHDAVVGPVWTDVVAGVEVERTRSAELLLSGGIDALFGSFDWVASWDGRLLTADYPYELDVQLGGRGLRLIPSHFCWRQPVALADATLPPVLVYPIAHRRTPLPRFAGVRHQEALVELLGRTRARVLAATAHGPLTTTELARRTNIAASSASEHLAVLRAAGLVRRRREANTALHVLTPIGEALLKGDEPEPMR
jgi:DNA-binding transcriptional ArsR family regulator